MSDLDREVLTCGRTPIVIEALLGQEYSSSHIIREVKDVGEANCISSLTSTNRHAPVLDIDFPARLVPSSSPGHFHLYLDKEMTWAVYSKLLDALADAGIVEANYVAAAKSYRMTTVRKPSERKSFASKDPYEMRIFVPVDDNAKGEIF